MKLIRLTSSSHNSVKDSVLEATEESFVYRNDSSIDPCQKSKSIIITRRLVWFISQMEPQHNMVSFAMDGHKYFN